MTEQVVTLRLQGKGGQQTAAELDRVTDSVQRGSQTATSAAKSMRAALFSVQGAIATLGIGAMARELVNTAREFQSLSASLETATGSTTAATVAFSQIEEFAKTTPYQLTEVVESFIKLKNLGLDPSEQALTSYGNTASAMGKSLDQLIEAVADAATGEFERLKEFGIKASQEGNRVRFTFRGVTTEVGKNAAEIEDYLQGLGQVEFAGGMERQMETIGGAMSNLEDSWDKLLRTLGETGAADAAEGAIRGLTGAIGSLTENLEEVKDAAAIVAAILAGRLTASLVSSGAAMATSTIQARAAAAAWAAMGGAAATSAVGVGALGRAMSLLGGPAGIVLAVASGITAYTLSIESAADQTRKLNELFPDLINGFESIGREAQIQQLQKRFNALSELESSLIDQLDELRQRESKQIGQYLQINNLAETRGEIQSVSADYENVSHVLNILQQKLAALRGVADDSAEGLAKVASGESIANLLDQIDAFAQGEEAVKAYQQSQKDAAQLAKLLSDATGEEAAAIRELFPLYIGARDAYEANIEKQRELAKAKLESERAAEKEAAKQAELNIVMDAYQRSLSEGISFVDAEQQVREESLSGIDAQIAAYRRMGSALDEQRGLGAEIASEQVSAIASLSAAFDEFDGPFNQAIGRMMDSLKTFQEAEKAGVREAGAIRARGYAQAISGLRGMADEGTAIYKALTLGSNVAALAAAQQAVATASTLPPPAGFISGAAMAAAMASIVTGFTGSFGGGGSVSGALDVGKAGFGESTVLGDAKAQSESITNAIDQLSDISTVGLKYTEQMAASLQNIEQALAGVASEFARVAGGEGIQQFGISGTFGNFNAGLSEVVAGQTVTSGASPQDIGRLARLVSNDAESVYLITYQMLEARDRLIEAANDPETTQAVDRISGLVQQTFDGIEASMIDAIEVLGGNTKAAAFLLSQQGIDLNLLEQDDIDKAINALFSGIADSAATIADEQLANIDLTDYQRVGEGLFETLIRVASGFEVVNTELARVGQSLDGIDVEASENLIALLGGIDEFAKATGDYIDAIYTDAEKLALQQADLARTFDVLGVAIPANDAAFKALVESLDLSTEAGQAMYAGLIQAAPLFGDVQDALKDSAQAAREFAADMADMADSLRRAQVGLAGGSVAAFDLGRLVTQISAATSVEELVGLIPALQSALNAQYQESIDGINEQTRAQQDANRVWLDGVTEAARAALDTQVDAINAAKDAQLAAIDVQLEGLREQIQLGEAMRDAAQGIRDYVDGVVRGQNQLQAQQGLTDVIAAALGGDLNATGQITGAATTAIDFARANARDRVEYLREENRILQQLTGAADVLGAVDIPTAQLQALEDSRDLLDAGFQSQVDAIRNQTDALIDGYKATADAMNAQAEAYGQQQAEWLAQQLSGSFDYLLSALDEAQAGGDLESIKADLIAAIGGTTQAVLQLQALQQLSEANVTGVLEFMTTAVQDIAADGQLNATQGFDQVVQALYGLEQTTLLSGDVGAQAVTYMNDALSDVLADGFLNQTQGFNDVASLLHLVNSTTALEAQQGRAAISVLEAALTDVIADGSLDTFSGLQGVINALAANGVDINALNAAAQDGLGNVANTTASWLSLVNSTSWDGSNNVVDYINSLIGTTASGDGVLSNLMQALDATTRVTGDGTTYAVGGTGGTNYWLREIWDVLASRMTPDISDIRYYTGETWVQSQRAANNAMSILHAFQDWAYDGNLGGYQQAYAKGGVFTNSIVSTPTTFNTGLMGEAGPEAIMPLTRGPNGALGVQSYGAGQEAMAQELRALRAELAALRSDQKTSQYAIAKNTGEQAKLMKRVVENDSLRIVGSEDQPVPTMLMEETP